MTDFEIKGAKQLYRHNETHMTDDAQCGWVGTEDEMGADACQMGDDEAWSNWICPKCGAWERLSDYERLSDVRIEIPGNKGV